MEVMPSGVWAAACLDGSDAQAHAPDVSENPDRARRASASGRSPAAAGAEEPGLLQALRYLLLTFRALQKTSGGRRAAGRMPPETVSEINKNKFKVAIQTFRDSFLFTNSFKFQDQCKK